MRKLPITLRGVSGKDDIAFIINAWLKSYEDAYFVRYIPSQIYFDEHRKMILKMIASEDTRVAVNQDDEDQILGFITFSSQKISKTPVIHYLYVKSAFRKLGVGTELLREAMHEAKHEDKLPLVTTAYSGQFKRFCEKPFVYNPYLLKDYL